MVDYFYLSFVKFFCKICVILQSFVKFLSLSSVMLIFADKRPGPMDDSSSDYIKLSFKEGCDPEFITNLNSALERKEWEKVPVLQDNRTMENRAQIAIKQRSGIVSIERSLQEKQRATDDSISLAFQDLKKLMGMAKNMVSISKSISAKIRVSKLLISRFFFQIFTTTPSLPPCE